MSTKFQKKIEDFICDNCHYEVKGTGYTNHCPNCLWSKHVDINPGDRASSCSGMMRPQGLFLKNKEKLIVHCCVKCGYKKINTAQSGDNQDLLIMLSTQPFKMK